MADLLWANFGGSVHARYGGLDGFGPCISVLLIFAQEHVHGIPLADLEAVREGVDIRKRLHTGVEHRYRLLELVSALSLGEEASTLGASDEEHIAEEEEVTALRLHRLRVQDLQVALLDELAPWLDEGLKNLTLGE